MGDLLVLVLLLGPAAAVSAVLLKQKYILFAIGLALVLLNFLSGAGPRSVPVFGGFGMLVWVVAAIRLAPPGSRWARQLYGPQKLAQARQRMTGAATPATEPPAATGDDDTATGTTTSAPAPPPDPVPDPVPAPLHERPASMTPIAVLTGAGLLGLGVAAGGLGLVAFGAALPVLWVMGAGWRRGRVVAAVIGGLVVAWAVVDMATGSAPVVRVVLLVLGVGLLAACTVRLYREPLDSYLHTATR